MLRLLYQDLPPLPSRPPFLYVLLLALTATLFPYTTLFRSLQDDPYGVEPGAAGRERHARLVPVLRWQPCKLARAHVRRIDRQSTRLNSSHVSISYAVFWLKKNKHTEKWGGIRLTPSTTNTQ